MKTFKSLREAGQLDRVNGKYHVFDLKDTNKTGDK